MNPPCPATPRKRRSEWNEHESLFNHAGNSSAADASLDCGRASYAYLGTNSRANGKRRSVCVFSCGTSMTTPQTPPAAQKLLERKHFCLASSLLCWLNGHSWGEFRMIKNFYSPYRVHHDELHERACEGCGKTERKIVYVHAR